MADKSPLLAVKEATATSATKERQEAHKFFKGRFLVIFLGVVGFVAVIVLGYWVRSLFNAELSELPLSTAIPVAILLFIISWAMPKFKKAPWLTDTIAIAGVIILGYALLTSGFGDAFRRTIDQAERCVGNQDCGPRAYEVPLINGGTLDIPAGTTKVVRIKGTVALQNRARYCLNISPQWSYAVEWTPDARRIYVTQLDNNDPPVTTITSIPVGQADCT